MNTWTVSFGSMDTCRLRKNDPLPDFIVALFLPHFNIFKELKKPAMRRVMTPLSL
jgi:hypothetical protein